jgi:hypothetical protein
MVSLTGLDPQGLDPGYLNSLFPFEEGAWKTNLS